MTDKYYVITSDYRWTGPFKVVTQTDLNFTLDNGSRFRKKCGTVWGNNRWSSVYALPVTDENTAKALHTNQTVEIVKTLDAISKKCVERSMVNRSHDELVQASMRLDKIKHDLDAFLKLLYL